MGGLFWMDYRTCTCSHEALSFGRSVDVSVALVQIRPTTGWWAGCVDGQVMPNMSCGECGIAPVVVFTQSAALSPSHYSMGAAESYRNPIGAV
jgi:hypothetical protein